VHLHLPPRLASPSGSYSEQIASHTDFHDAAPQHAEVDAVQPDFATNSQDLSGGTENDPGSTRITFLVSG
jgi:hypothetical protein